MIKPTFLAIALLGFTNPALAADARLHCKLKQGSIVSTKANDNYDFLSSCGDQVFSGDVCFTGKRAGTMDLLEQLDSEDIFGGEYSIKNIHYKGKDEIAYTIWDGPNETVATENSIGRCGQDFWK